MVGARSGNGAPVIRLVVGLCASLLGACSDLIGERSDLIDYSFIPAEFGQDYGAKAAAFPTIDCSSNGNVCGSIAKLPEGNVPSCEAATGKCIATWTVDLVSAVNLLDDSKFPLASAMAASSVALLSIAYWTPSNTLNTSPGVSFYVGPRSALSHVGAGVTLLGAMGALPPTTKTNCQSTGAPGTQANGCTLPLTPDGQTALARFAGDWSTTFSLIVSTSLTVHATEPVPSGNLHVMVQPQIEYTVLK